MRILRFSLTNISDKEFTFDEARFERVNLLVGDSGTGKTRFLNAVVNFFSQLVSDKVRYYGKWDVDFESDGIVYNYKLHVTQSSRTLREKNDKHGNFIKK